MSDEKNKVAIHSDVDTPFGRQHFNPKKGTSWHTYVGAEPRLIPLRKKYRKR